MNLEVKGIIKLLHKSIISKNYDFVPTKKNRDTRRKYGLTIFDIEDILLSVREKDLVSGPIADRDKNDEVIFIFKKEKRKIIFYIKIKKDSNVNYNRIKILSFHEDEKMEDLV